MAQFLNHLTPIESYLQSYFLNIKRITNLITKIFIIIEKRADFDKSALKL